jgi:hypothetical protein
VAGGADRDRRQDVCVLGPALPCTSPPFVFSLASACCRPPDSPTDHGPPSLQACKTAARINCPSFSCMHASSMDVIIRRALPKLQDNRPVCVRLTRSAQSTNQPARSAMSPPPPPQQHERAKATLPACSTYACDMDNAAGFVLLALHGRTA